MVRSFLLLVIALHCSTLGAVQTTERTDDVNNISSKETSECATLHTLNQDDKRPVIIDTDIGSFDDDPVAIALALSRPELDVKLVITCSDDTTERARIAAKYLTLLGRDDMESVINQHPLVTIRTGLGQMDTIFPIMAEIYLNPVTITACCFI